MSAPTPAPQLGSNPEIDSRIGGAECSPCPLCPFVAIPYPSCCVQRRKLPVTFRQREHLSLSRQKTSGICECTLLYFHCATVFLPLFLYALLVGCSRPVSLWISVPFLS